MSLLTLPLAAGSYSISSGYGPRSGGFHRGIDYAAALGTAIYAAGNGTVAAAGSASGFGQWIIIDHILNGSKVSTVYGHMYPSGMHVHAGQIVTAGQHIADVGANGEATGPHLHFEVWPGGRLTGGHDVDPSTYVSGDAAPTAQPVGYQNAGIVDNLGNILIPGYGLVDTKGMGDLLGGITTAISFLVDPHNWWRMFMFLCGVAALSYVLWSTMNGVAK